MRPSRRHKEVAGRLAVVEAENAEYRAVGKAHEFEERIHVGSPLFCLPQPARL